MHTTIHLPRPKRRRLPLPPTPTLPNAEALLTAREAAAYRRQGVSTFWRDVRAGTVPKPVRITPKAPRWRLSDLCPGRTT